jgi:hypothetical protein
VRLQREVGSVLLPAAHLAAKRRQNKNTSIASSRGTLSFAGWGPRRAVLPFKVAILLQPFLAIGGLTYFFLGR